MLAHVSGRGTRSRLRMSGAWTKALSLNAQELASGDGTVAKNTSNLNDERTMNLVMPGVMSGWHLSRWIDVWRSIMSWSFFFLRKPTVAAHGDTY